MKFGSYLFLIHSQDEIERKGSITVDYKELMSDGRVTESIPDLRTDIKEMPEKILNCLGLAIHQVGYSNIYGTIIH